MIVFDLVGDNEGNPIYQALQVQNQSRQYEFIESIVQAALGTNQQFLSTVVIKSLNHHAIACLHAGAGEYRSCKVEVWSNGGEKPDYVPPAAHRVPALMDHMINWVNRQWGAMDPVVLATFVLWRLNWIHPFVNGNGRTARAAAYYVLCISSGGWLPGDVILPELLRLNREEYVAALRHTDKTFNNTGNPDMGPLHSLISRLLGEQVGPFSGNGGGVPKGGDAPEDE